MTISFDEKHHVELQNKLPAAQSYYSWFQDQNLHQYLPDVNMIFLYILLSVADPVMQLGICWCRSGIHIYLVLYFLRCMGQRWYLALLILPPYVSGIDGKSPGSQRRGIYKNKKKCRNFRFPARRINCARITPTNIQ